MKYGAGVLAAVALAGLASGAARAQDPIAEVKKQVAALERAAKTEDRKAYERIYHPEGVFITAWGDRLNLAKYIEDNVKWRKGRTFSKMEETGHRFLVQGDTVIETGTVRMAGTFQGKPFVHRFHYSATWLKLKGVWRLASEQATLVPDGKK